jgi:renin receptor
MASSCSDFLQVSQLKLLIGVVVALIPYIGGTFIIVSSPRQVQFVDPRVSDTLPLSEFNNVLLTLFGETLDSEMSWSGLKQINPFHTIDSSVLVVVNSSLKLAPLFTEDNDWLQYSTVQDTELDTGVVVNNLNQRPSSRYFRGLVHEEHFTMDTNLASDVQEFLENGNKETKHKIQKSRFGQLQFELDVIKNVTKMVEKRQEFGEKSFFQFEISGFERLLKDELKTGVEMLENAMRQVVEDLVSSGSGNVFVHLLIVDTTFSCSSSDHQFRRLLQNPTSASNTLVNHISHLDNLNLAPTFNWLYPELFQIGLWFTIVFTLIVFGVGWCMWFIDPGYDSVIYRLTTSPKMKNE